MRRLGIPNQGMMRITKTIMTRTMMIRYLKKMTIMKQVKRLEMTCLMMNMNTKKLKKVPEVWV